MGKRAKGEKGKKKDKRRVFSDNLIL